MHRHILLPSPITYVALNGYRINYNCLDVRYSSKGNLQLKLTVNEGCAPYNDIQLTTDLPRIPDQHVALKPSIPSYDVVIPALIVRGILTPNNEKPSIFSDGITYPLYKLNVPVNVSRQEKYEKALQQA